MKRDNKGYSLVELIIVIAILMVLIGSTIFSIGIVFNAGAKACANDIKNALAQNKVTAMGRSDAYVEIYKNDTDQCIYSRQCIKTSSGWQDGDWEKIGNARVYVAYTPEGGSETELTAGSSIKICIDRSSGSFRADAGTGAAVYSEILVQSGHRAYKITMTKLTGKVSLEVV